jgi:hypothetical protein
VILLASKIYPTTTTETTTNTINNTMENTPEQQAEGQAIVQVLAAVLERLVCTNASLARSDPGQVTKFHALKSPGIGILPYLERIHKYASCSNECFILALIYIDRLIQRNNFLLTELNVHRVVITAILLAAKFFDDAYYNNAYYSKVGGVLVSEMNGLEVDFLFRINFSLHVTPEVFEKYKAELVAHLISSGVTMPSSGLTMPETATIPESTVSAGPMDVVAATTPMVPEPQRSAPITIQQQQELRTHLPIPPPHVTPSPSHAASLNVQIATDPSSCPNPMTQSFIQRTKSLPPFPSYSGRCVDKHPPYSSAPMVSMLPVDAEQYIMVNNQIFPLQTTLVHHHHGLENYHEPAAHYHPQVHGNGYAITRESVGSLVAGHY